MHNSDYDQTNYAVNVVCMEVSVVSFIKRLLPIESSVEEDDESSIPMKKVAKSVEKNVQYLIDELNKTDDLRMRIFEQEKAVLLYYETLVDLEKMQNRIFSPLTEGEHVHIETLPWAITTGNLNQVVRDLLQGQAVYLKEGSSEVITFNVDSVFNRDASEPDIEKVVRGPHDGLVEQLSVNINQIRKRIQNHNLVVRYYQLGKKTNTKIAVMYMKDIADPSIVDEVDRRLRAIQADMILSPGFLEEYLDDSTMSPFPQMLSTERPDRVTANIMDGRISIMADGSPTALVVPVTFFSFYQAPEDYNSRWYAGSFIRMIRLASFIIAIGLPAFYIAVVSYHFEVIPDSLIIPIKSSINDIPFPPLIEALMMVVIIELIREAGIRLPSPVGQTIGIVGGLVIGDAVVKAGLISNIMVIVIALTAIASFVVPSNELSITLRILTFPFILAAGTLGFVGIVFLLLLLLIHLTKLQSFGTPYFAPMTPLRIKDLKDTFLRFPINMMRTRPKDAHPQKMSTGGDSRGWRKRGRK
ncbi:spore germination protein [Pontibacillus halophilus]|nr:spore germination protein [Pontibacillus halophilus]